MGISNGIDSFQQSVIYGETPNATGFNNFSSAVSRLVKYLGGPEAVTNMDIREYYSDIERINDVFDFARRNVLPKIKSKEESTPDKYETTLKSLFFTYDNTSRFLRCNKNDLPKVMEFENALTLAIIPHLKEFPTISLTRIVESAFRSHLNLPTEFVSEWCDNVANKLNNINNRQPNISDSDKISNKQAAMMMYNLNGMGHKASNRLVKEIINYATENMDQFTGGEATHLVYSLSHQDPKIFSEITGQLISKWANKIEQELENLKYSELRSVVPSNLKEMGFKIIKEDKPGKPEQILEIKEIKSKNILEKLTFYFARPIDFEVVKKESNDSGKQGNISNQFLEKYSKAFLKSWVSEFYDCCKGMIELEAQEKNVSGHRKYLDKLIDELMNNSKNLKRLGYKASKEYSSNLEECATSTISFFSAKQLSNFMHLFTEIGRKPNTELKHIWEDECIKKFNDFTPQGLAVSFNSIAKLDLIPSYKWMNEWEKQAVPKIREGYFNPMELSNSLYAYARTETIPSKIFMDNWYKACGHKNWNRHLKEKVEFTQHDIAISIYSLTRLTAVYRERVKKYPSEADAAQQFEKTARNEVAIMIGRLDKTIDNPTQFNIKEAIEIFGFNHIKLDMWKVKNDKSVKSENLIT